MKTKLSTIANIVICAFGGFFLLLLLFKYALPALLPVLLGWLFSLICVPLATKIFSKSSASKRFVRGFLCILIIILLFVLIGLCARRLILELSEYIEKLTDDPQILEGALQDVIQKTQNSKFFRGIEKIASQLDKYAAHADAVILNVIEKLLSGLTSYVSSVAKSAILGIPTAFLFIITFIISSYYFCVDREKIYSFFSSIIPQGAKSFLEKAKRTISDSVLSYLKASLILLLITFVEVFLGLCLLRVRYALLISALVAIVDFLPILGAGIVLIPWAIYCFIVSKSGLGIGLVLLFLAVTIVRRLLEPKIMAKKMGVHPLLMISSIYVGLRLFGGVGLILAPLLCASLGCFFRVDNEINPQ